MAQILTALLHAGLPLEDHRHPWAPEARASQCSLWEHREYLCTEQVCEWA
jgi:hypothetical protein